ncbi:MAG: hypothetical protein ACRC6E_09770 [Fusobacteriaceae bacterium]
MVKKGDAVCLYNTQGIEIEGVRKEVCSFVAEVIVVEDNQGRRFVVAENTITDIGVMECTENIGWFIAPQEEVENLKAQYVEYCVIKKVEIEKNKCDRDINYFANNLKKIEVKMNILEEERSDTTYELDRSKGLKNLALKVEAKALENLKKLINEKRENTNGDQ